MNLYDFADTVGARVKWEKQPNDKWVYCWLDGVVARLPESKKNSDPVLERYNLKKPDNCEDRKTWFCYQGRGKTPREALTDLTETLRGANIAFEGDIKQGVDLRHMQVPRTIEV